MSDGDERVSLSTDGNIFKDTNCFLGKLRTGLKTHQKIPGQFINEEKVLQKVDPVTSKLQKWMDGILGE